MKMSAINTTLVDLVKIVSMEVNHLDLSKNRKRKLVSYIVTDILSNSHVSKRERRKKVVAL